MSGVMYEVYMYFLKCHLCILLHSVPPSAGGKQISQKLVSQRLSLLSDGGRLHFRGSICLGGPAIFLQHFC